MKYAMKSDHPVTDEAAKAATGKTLAEWFSYLDSWDGLEKGRREIGNHLFGEKIDPWWSTTIAVEYERARDQRKKDGLFEGYFICSTKTIAAPLEKVYGAWADSGSLSRWFGEGVKAEVKDGGAFQCADGDKGSFLRVRENKDLRISFENPAFSAATLVDAQFQDKGGGKTGILVNHTRIQTREEADSLRAAWAEALNKLKALVE